MANSFHLFMWKCPWLFLQASAETSVQFKSSQERASSPALTSSLRVNWPPFCQFTIPACLRSVAGTAALQLFISFGRRCALIYGGICSQNNLLIFDSHHWMRANLKSKHDPKTDIFSFFFFPLVLWLESRCNTSREQRWECVFRRRTTYVKGFSKRHPREPKISPSVQKAWPRKSCKGARRRE